MKVKAIGYIRVSTQEQADEGISLQNQRERISAYCEYKDIELVDIIEDVMSGGKNKSRVGFNTLLDAIESSEADIVVLYSLERLSRDMLTMLALERYLNEYDVKLHTVDGVINTDTPDGWMSFAMKAFIGEMERRNIKYRTKKGMEHIKASGYAVGTIPYGYGYVEEVHEVMVKGKVVEKIKKRLIENEEEQHIINMVDELYCDSVSISEIARSLNSRGYKSRTGKAFDTTQVKRMINGYTAGWRRKKGTKVETIRNFINSMD